MPPPAPLLPVRPGGFGTPLRQLIDQYTYTNRLCEECDMPHTSDRVADFERGRILLKRLVRLRPRSRAGPLRPSRCLGRAFGIMRPHAACSNPSTDRAESSVELAQFPPHDFASRGLR